MTCPSIRLAGRPTSRNLPPRCPASLASRFDGAAMNILGLATSSFWLWWLTGTVLWAFIGLLVSSSTGTSLWLGALAGAVGWFFGVTVVLIIGLSRNQRHRAPAAASLYLDEGSRFAAPPVHEFGGIGDGFDSAPTGRAFTSNGLGLGSTAGFGGGTDPGAFALVSSVSAGGVGRTRRFTGAQLALLVAAAIAGGLMVLSDFGNWVVASEALNGRDSAFEQEWGPKDLIPMSIW